MHLNQYILLLAAIILAISFQLATAEEFTHIVQLKNGKVNGKIETVEEGGQKVEFFEGIRYATAKRYQLPQPVHPWTYVYPALSQREGCPYFGINITMPNQTTKYDEDCLFLNIWRPHEVKQNRSVMVFIHGGAFIAGTIFNDMYDGKYIAAKGDVIVVAFQYRLGPLGFISGGNVTANLGLHDQLFALRFIKENIAAFGGNPEDITIFGESAGSMSVGALILSPLAKGLFKRGIMESGAPSSNLIVDSPESAKARVIRFAKKLNCTIDEKLEATMGCLAGKSVEALQAVSEGDFVANDFFIPVYGDEVLPVKPEVALAKGQVNDVDLIFGINRDEGTYFAMQFTPEILNGNMTIESTRKAIIKLMGIYNQSAIAEEVAEFYIGKLGSNLTQADFILTVSSVWGDYGMVCPTLFFGEEFAKKATGRKVYFYRLMQSAPMPGFLLPPWTGVPHGQDIYYLFQAQFAKSDPHQHQLSEDMIHSWTSFSKSSVPGAMSGVQWTEALNRTSGVVRHMHLEAGAYRMVPGYFKEVCEEFWRPKIFV